MKLLKKLKDFSAISTDIVVNIRKTICAVYISIEILKWLF